VATRTDTLLAHTLARVLIAEGVTHADEVGKWKAAKAVPKGSRITAFIVLWAQAERDLGRKLDGIEEYREYWNESERSAYRRQAEFRDVWGAESFRLLVDAVKAQLDANERALHEKFNLGRAMSLQIAVEETTPR
jgi:hypothetical protein